MRHRTERHQVPRHRVERHQAGCEQPSEYQAQLTAPGFVTLFNDMLAKPQHTTQAEAYRAAERYHTQQFGRQRFASYHSFRQAKKAWEVRG